MHGAAAAAGNGGALPSVSSVFGALGGGGTGAAEGPSRKGQVIQPEPPAAPPMIQGGVIPHQNPVAGAQMPMPPQNRGLFRNFDPYASQNWPYSG